MYVEADPENLPGGEEPEPGRELVGEGGSRPCRGGEPRDNFPLAVLLAGNLLDISPERQAEDALDRQFVGSMARNLCRQASHAPPEWMRCKSRVDGASDATSGCVC